MTKPKFSIIIVSYNVWEYLAKCLSSIYQQTETNFEVIVIDNNSADNTAVNISKQFPQVTLIANKHNAGFSAANNQGIKISTGDNIFLLNPDTELLDKTILSKLTYSITIEADADAFCPRLLNGNGSIQASCWLFPKLSTLFLELLYIHLLSATKNSFAPDDKMFVEAASGAALIFRRSLVEKVGLLDETLFWTEDTDYCYRINKAGKKLLYLPDVQIIHHIGKSATKNYNAAIPNQLLSKLKFFKKHYSSTSFIIADILIFLFILTRLFAFTILSPFGLILRKKRNAYFFSLKKYWWYNFNNDNSIAA